MIPVSCSSTYSATEKIEPSDTIKAEINIAGGQILLHTNTQCTTCTLNTDECIILPKLSGNGASDEAPVFSKLALCCEYIEVSRRGVVLSLATKYRVIVLCSCLGRTLL